MFARRRFVLRLVPLLLVGMCGPLARLHAQADEPPRPGNGAPETLTHEAKRGAIEALIGALEREYVFPDVARKMADDLQERLAAGEYEATQGGREFAELVTQHARAISHDKHLGVRFSDSPLPPPSADTPDDVQSPEQRREMEAFAAGVNFGFEKAERLSGNVGYLNLRGFMPPSIAGETATAAMNFLAHADALIIDLRQNGGGDPAMVAYLTSYLLDGEPTHLNDLYDRPSDQTHQWWTLPHVPGKRPGGTKPLYVLTSSRTFSAGEEFTYNLKSLKRATIVGETTGGGAHPGSTRWLTEHFEAFIPSGRAINPITHTNWEGTGVEPDIAIGSDLALKRAHAEALRAILKADPRPDDKRRASDFQSAIDRLDHEIEAEQKPADPANPAPRS